VRLSVGDTASANCSIGVVMSGMPLAGPIVEPLSSSFFHERVFKNEISSSCLLDIQLTVLCICGVDLFIPEMEHLTEKRFYGLFSKKKPLKSRC